MATTKAQDAAKPAAQKRKQSGKPAKPVDPEKRALDAKERAFVREFLVDRDARRAAIAAGYSETMANTKVYQWVRDSKVKPWVYAAVKAGEKKLSERTEITQEMVLKRYWDIATANPNELIEHRRLCCRHCFGTGHAYQWKDEAEFELQVRANIANDLEPPTEDGGYGFNPTLRPHPLCPECHGEGNGRVHAHDTRDLSPAALALYAGVKVTKEGFEVKTHDQLAALEKVARHLGMFNEKLMLQTDPEDPLVQLLKQVAGRTLKPGGQ